MKRRLSTFQAILLGFLAIIAVGGCLLMLPAATAAPGGAPPADAFFTAVSAVCVTGLVVCDTAVTWSLFGQAVVLTLIQIGGLGVVTVATALALASGRKIGLWQRLAVRDSLSAPNGGGMLRLVLFLLKIVLAAEGLGAAALAPVFCRDFGFWSGLWRSVFLSVSAFCNAGFDILGTKSAPFCSLTAYAANGWVCCVIMLLIVVGGLGFLTLGDLLRHGWRVRRWRLQTKLVLATTALLIVLPALYFYLLSFTGVRPVAAGVLQSLFQSVTLRTAGFNTVDFARLSEPVKAVMIPLMLVGGAPGSTAGGMKVTTLAVLTLSAFAVFRRRPAATCFGRRLPAELPRLAGALLALYLLLFFTGGLALCLLENLPLLDCLFETASALGTVGLTVGITPGLCLASRLILMALMYCGRVGGLTLFYAALSPLRQAGARYPEETVAVG